MGWNRPKLGPHTVEDQLLEVPPMTKKYQEFLVHHEVELTSPLSEYTPQALSLLLLEYFKRNYNLTINKCFFFNRGSFINPDKQDVLRIRLNYLSYYIDCVISIGKSGLIAAFVPSVLLKKESNSL